MSTATVDRGEARVAGRPLGLRTALLSCGALSSVLYAATDLFGGLHFPGYSFSSMMVSELMAVGAPSEAFVDPLFLAYDVLMIAFGVGVLREGGRGSRALKVAGALLIAYGAVGLTGPTLFEMHPRGTAPISADLPHIVATGVLLLLTLVAIGFGAAALGLRFGAFSFATVATNLGVGAVMSRYSARLVEGGPTPGFGTLERVNIYCLMLWTAVFAVALVRRAQPATSAASAAG